MREKWSLILLQHGQMNQCEDLVVFGLDFWLNLLVCVDVGPKGLAEV